MAKMKVLTDTGLATYDENIKSFIRSQGLGLSEDDVNGLINQKLVPVNETIDDKVDKVDGMGLSTNDYTDEDKSKVDSIPTDAKFTDTVYDDTELSGRVDGLEADSHAHSNKTVLDATTASFTVAEKEKLSAIGSITTTKIDALFA